MRARGLGRARRGILGAGVLVVLGVALACCQQILSIDGTIRVQDAAAMDVEEAAAEAGDAGEAGVDCGITVPEGACADCVMASCCPQLSACAGDPQCRQLETCLLACGSDYACRSACNSAAYPVGGQTDIPAVDTCVAASCRGPCGTPCGQAASYATPADAGPGCETCIEHVACGPALACATNLDCEIAAHCAYACTTPDCRAACASDSGADLSLANAAVLAGALCYAECMIGENWTCAHHVVWPSADAAAQEATLTLTNGFNDSGVPIIGGPAVAGVSVKACGLGDVSCTPPLSTGTTDDAGVVTMPGLGKPMLFGFAGHFEMTAPAYVPDLYYLSFPLSQPNSQLGLTLMSQATFAITLGRIHVTPVAGMGHVWATVGDCLLLPASNVVVKADGIDPSRVVYFANGNPSLTATSTDPSGLAFIFNVTPGPLTLHAIPNALGIESSLTTVNVRADAMTVVTLIPTAIP